MFSQFTRIVSIEQRRRYKTEFDNDYAEYMKLHAENERVSKRFAQLEESLRNEERNDQRKKVKFLQNNFDSTMDLANRTFCFLHSFCRKFNGKSLTNTSVRCATHGTKTLKNGNYTPFSYLFGQISFDAQHFNSHFCVMHSHIHWNIYMYFGQFSLFNLGSIICTINFRI